MGDEIQGRQAALDDIRRTSCVNDMPRLRLGYKILMGSFGKTGSHFIENGFTF